MPKVTNKRNKDQAPKITPMLASQMPILMQDKDFKTIYTNFVNANYSPFDIVLMLGELMGPAPDGKQVVLQRAKVVMSPVEAKIVAAILNGAVSKFEKRFGRLVISRELMPREVEGV